MNINKIKYFIEKSREGLLILSVINDAGKKIYLHSKYNPLKEAESFKNKFIPEKFDMLVILGAGLGYHLLTLKNIIEKYNKIIIIDIIRDIEKEISKNPETGFLVRWPQIKFLTGAEFNEIEDFFNTEINFTRIKGIDVIEHPSSVRAFGDFYNEVKKIVRLVINKKAGNAATQKAFGSLYLKNIYKNYNYFSSLYAVSAFFRTMTDYPVIIIASGPGMENYLQEIRTSQNKFFIIAADSAMNTLIQNEIIADFFVSIDPQLFTVEHIFALNRNSTIPIFTLSSCPLIVERLKGSRGLLSLNTHPVSQIADDMFPDMLGSIDSRTGTVAGDAIMTAQEFGFSTTGLIGFDFSFPDFKIYPSGSAYQKRFQNVSSRFNPIETINFNYVMKSSKGMKHENKFTRKSFIQYKESIESFLKNINSNKIFNINKKGIPIQGLKNIDLNYFINNYCRSDIDKQAVIKNRFDETVKSGKLISYKNLKNFIQNKNTFIEILNASLDVEKVEIRRGRLMTLFKNITI
jgi:hypothetical protein